METEKKKKVGRPLIQLTDLRKDWKELIFDEMSQGASQQEIQAYLDICDTTFSRLMRDEKEFSRAIKRGRRLSRCWWENQARTSLRDKDFSPTLWYMNMKNRFGWKDKIDHTTNNKDLPQPIYGGLSIQKHDSDQEDI